MFDDIGARSQNKGLRRACSFDQKTVYGTDSSLEFTGFECADLVIEVQRREAWRSHAGSDSILENNAFRKRFIHNDSICGMMVNVSENSLKKDEDDS